jgi:hypothetical protein
MKSGSGKEQIRKRKTSKGEILEFSTTLKYNGASGSERVSRMRSKTHFPKKIMPRTHSSGSTLAPLSSSTGSLPQVQPWQHSARIVFCLSQGSATTGGFFSCKERDAL